MNRSESSLELSGRSPYTSISAELRYHLHALLIAVA